MKRFEALVEVDIERKCARKLGWGVTSEQSFVLKGTTDFKKKNVLTEAHFPTIPI